MSKVTVWRSRWRCVIKPAYSVSFLLSINIFVWQNVLYFPNDLRTLHSFYVSAVRHDIKIPLYEGGLKKTGISLKKLDLFIFRTKNVFFIVGNKKKSQGARKTNGKTNHSISTILGAFFSHSLSIASKPPSKIPVASEISSIVYRRSSLICSRIFSTFSSVRLVDGRPEWGWSSTLISPLLNRANHSKTCVRLSASSLKAFWSISCASAVVIPKRKQNLKQIRCSVRSDITISREELDNNWENWQHKPVQISTATSAWLLTREGCNYTHLAEEHSTTIRKSSPKPDRFFWVPPRIVTFVILGCRNDFLSV